VWDYKSGSIDKAPQSVERIAAALAQNTRLAIRDSIKSFQLPLYAYVVSAQYPQHGVDAKLYSLQDGRNCGLFKNKKDEGRHDEKLSLCMDTLGTVINEINDPAADFAPDESDGAQCANCPYRLMCR
jgi:hypothetical protein